MGLTARLDERPAPAPARPRIGFLGVGWIGRHRMEAMLATGAVTAAAFVDPADDVADAVAAFSPEAERMPSFDALLALGLDALVIATPSAAHAEQSIAAFEAGTAVFCQKPVGRNSSEVSAVVEAARKADRLLGVDLSYRFIDGAKRIRDLVRGGGLGRVYAADLVFHNAYGPDKPWFYDRAQSGGGCVIDLGVHLVDLAHWIFDERVVDVQSRLFCKAEPLGPTQGEVEDYAVATLTLASGAVVRLACSWRLPAGRDAVISASFYGSDAGAELRNVDGSFYEFTAERFEGVTRETLAAPNADWNQGAARDFAHRLAASARFDPAIASAIDVARTVDRIYGRHNQAAG